MEVDRRQYVTSFSSVARRALANVIGRSWRQKADAVLAVVMCARTRLWVQQVYLWQFLTQLAIVPMRTLTPVPVYFVYARAPVLAHVKGTVVSVLGAIGAHPAGRAVAFIAILHFGTLAILAWVEFFGAEIDLFGTKFAMVAGRTLASVRVNAIHTGRVVLALVHFTIVYIRLTPFPFVACKEMFW